MHTDERITSSVIKPVIDFTNQCKPIEVAVSLLCFAFPLHEEELPSSHSSYSFTSRSSSCCCFYSCAVQDMSTYGGDSWMPEALHRKRRVDDLLADDIDDAHVHRLSNGRLACLVCPHCPVLDTVPMLLIHRKGAKHQAAVLKLQDKEFRLQNEIQKRVALAASSASVPQRTGSLKGLSSSSPPVCSPLVATTRKRTAEALSGMMAEPSPASPYTCQPYARVDPYVQKRTTVRQPLFFSPAPANTTKSAAELKEVSTPTVQRRREQEVGKATANRQQGQTNTMPRKTSAQVVVPKASQEYQKERGRQLRLREAGWRLDGNGKWFKDENVEFDSDEEVPEIVS